MSTERVAGVNAHRLNKHNPREVAFAQRWDAENEVDDVLRLLCSPACGENDPGATRVINSLSGYRQFPLGPITTRDRMIAATVIQWLGSNVGLSFLMEALRRCGYTVQRSIVTPEELKHE